MTVRTPHAAALLSGTALLIAGAMPSAARAQEATLVLGHVGSATDPREEAATRFKSIVEERSEGRVAVEVHGNSTLGTWEEMIEGLQFGTTDIVIESLLALEAYTDLAGIETAPFLYSTPDEFFATWDGELGQEIKDAITEASGYAVLGNLYRGARELTTKEPVTRLDQLEGLTIRTPSAPTMVATWRALGARAEAMPWPEVYSALEQGVIDGQENPLDVIAFNDIYEVAPQIAETSHLHANFHFLMWDEALEGLSEEDRRIVREAAETVGEEYTEKTLANQEAYREDLVSKGASFNAIEDRDAWVEAVQPVVDGLPERVQEWIAEIRG